MEIEIPIKEETLERSGLQFTDRTPVEPAPEPTAPTFANCWADTHKSLHIENIEGVEFTLRPITVDEQARIVQESKVPPAELPQADPQDVEGLAQALGKTTADLTAAEKLQLGRMASRATAEATVDNWLFQVLTVGASLGVWDRFGSEGWSDARPCDLEAVKRLRAPVLALLFGRYSHYFRSIKRPVGKPPTGGVVGV